MSITSDTTDLEVVKAPAGMVAVPLKSQKHADLTAAAVKGSKAKVTEWTLLVPRDPNVASNIAAKLAEAGTASGHIYDARLLTASWLGIAMAIPKLVVPGRGTTRTLVEVLNATCPGKWDVAIRIDGTVTYAGPGFEDLGARAALAKVDGAPAKSAPAAKKAPAKKAPAKKAAK